jgi:hypothetical protein
MMVVGAVLGGRASAGSPPCSGRINGVKGYLGDILSYSPFMA